MEAFQINDIEYEVEINCPVGKLWRRWTTEEGLTSFLAEEVRLDFRVEGYFEVFFDPLAPPGLRGSEGMKILSYEVGKMLSFTWSAPPSIPEIRKQINFYQKV